MIGNFIFFFLLALEAACDPCGTSNTLVGNDKQILQNFFRRRQPLFLGGRCGIGDIFHDWSAMLKTASTEV